MTSISKNVHPRKPRKLRIAVVLSLGAVALVGGGAILIRATEPALAASEEVAATDAFRIRTPKAVDQSGNIALPLPAASDDVATTALPPAFDKASCIATRAGRKTDRHDPLQPQAFCQLQRRLLYAELIYRMEVLRLGSQTRFIHPSSQLAMNKEF